MKRFLTAAVAVVALLSSFAAQAADPKLRIKTRLDHLAGSPYVVIINYLPVEITNISCDTWTMLGIGSWKGHNDFTIPAGPSIAIMDASKFDGYCKTKGSIVGHTDDGDFIGTLDRGDGNWNASTKLTFDK